MTMFGLDPISVLRRNTVGELPGSPPAPAWTPTDVAGLVAWWDFSDITKLYTDSGKTTPVASDNDVIGAVEDKSTAANDLTQNVTARKGLYKVNIQNGYSVGRFDGSDDRLDMGSLIALAPSTVLMSVVSRADGTTFEGIIKTDEDGGGRLGPDAGGQSYILFTDGSLNRIYTNPGWNGASTDAWRMFTFAIATTAVQDFDLYENSTLIGGDTTHPVLTASYTQVNFDNIPGQVDIGEVLAYDSKLAGDDLTNAETYMIDRWL